MNVREGGWILSERPRGLTLESSSCFVFFFSLLFYRDKHLKNSTGIDKVVSIEQKETRSSERKKHTILFTLFTTALAY